MKNLKLVIAAFCLLFMAGIQSTFAQGEIKKAVKEAKENVAEESTEEVKEEVEEVMPAEGGEAQEMKAREEDLNNEEEEEEEEEK